MIRNGSNTPTGKCITYILLVSRSFHSLALSWTLSNWS
jgi:hypothetical protein